MNEGAPTALAIRDDDADLSGGATSEVRLSHEVVLPEDILSQQFRMDLQAVVVPMALLAVLALWAANLKRASVAVSITASVVGSLQRWLLRDASRSPQSATTAVPRSAPSRHSTELHGAEP